MNRYRVTAEQMRTFTSDSVSFARLSSYLARVEKGMASDIRTPFWGEQSRQSIAEKWSERLFYHDDLPVELEKLELKQRQKIGPLSVQLPYESRVDTIESYFRPKSFSVDEDLWQQAIEKVALSFGIHRVLRPIKKSSAADLMQNTTNSGLPFFKKRESARSSDLALAESGRWFDSKYPCVLGWRGQSSGSAVPKQRVVWMFPQSVNIVEASYFSVMQELMVHDAMSVAAWIDPIHEVDSRITRLFAWARERGSVIFSIDYSGYDQTLQKHLSDACLSVFKLLFQTSYHDELTKLFSYSGEVGLLAPFELWEGAHGEPSGSNLTNMRDTVVNWIVNEYLSLRLDNQLNPFSQYQGDDGVISFNGNVELERITEVYKECGLEANSEKQYTSAYSLMYLQKLHMSDYVIDGKNVGVYPTMRALNSLMGMERWHPDWDEKMVTLRAIMILENCKYHPKFTKFIDFVQEGDRYRLGSGFPGGINGLLSNKVINQAKSIPGFISSYNSPKLTGIRQFDTVKYIASKE